LRETFARIDTSFDPAAAEGFDDRENPTQEIVVLLFRLQALVERRSNTLPQPVKQRLPRTRGHFRAHQNANPVQLLPTPVEGQQGANLEVAGGDIEGTSDLRPFFEVAEALPILVGVIDDE
jgi:hypothetical protein